MSSQVPIIKTRHNYGENIWLLHIIQLQNHSILTLLLFSRSKKHRLVKNSGWNQVAYIEGQLQPHPCGWRCQWPSPDFFHINQTLIVFRYQRCMDLGSTGHCPHTHTSYGDYISLCQSLLWEWPYNIILAIETKVKTAEKFRKISSHS